MDLQRLYNDIPDNLKADMAKPVKAELEKVLNRIQSDQLYAHRLTSLISQLENKEIVNGLSAVSAINKKSLEEYIKSDAKNEIFQHLYANANNWIQKVQIAMDYIGHPASSREIVNVIMNVFDREIDAVKALRSVSATITNRENSEFFEDRETLNGTTRYVIKNPYKQNATEGVAN